MGLVTKSFRLTKTDSTNQINQFLRTSLGYNAHLFRDLEVTYLRNNIIQINIVYDEYPDLIYDSFAPRKGAIFTSDIVSSDFDARILFKDKIDISTLESGTFVVDGIGLPTGSVKFPIEYGSYYAKINLSGYTSESFHDLRLDSSKIKRYNGSSFDYSPVGGYVLHSQSSAHLGEEMAPLRSRIRGFLNLGVIEAGKGYNVERATYDIFNRYNISSSQLLEYKVTELNGVVFIYFIYVSPQEPQIIQGFPLNNSLFPDVSSPDYVTLVFSTELSRSDIKNNFFFAVDSGFNSTVDIDPEDIELLSDNRTVRIDVSSYFSSQKVYTILVKPGLTTSKGFKKERPEQWTIHVNRYEGGSSSSAGVTRLNNLSGNITLQGIGNVSITDNGSNVISLSGTDYNDIITGHTGQTGIHYPQSAISISETQIHDLKEYTEITLFSGHVTGEDPHDIYILADGSRSFTNPVIGSNPTSSNHLATKAYVDDSITNSASGASPSASYLIWENSEVSLSNEKTISGQSGISIDRSSSPVTVSWDYLNQFIGHTGSGEIHYPESSIDHENIQNIGTYTHINIDSHINSSSNPHSVTASQVGAPSLDVFTGHTGQTGIHFTQDQISITESQISDLGDYALDSKVNNISGYFESHVQSTSNPHNVTASQVGSPTISDFNSHTGSSGVHFTQAEINITESQISDLQDYVLADGSVGFVGRISGIFPVSSDHLATKEYVDSVALSQQIEDLEDIGNVSVSDPGSFLYNNAGNWEGFSLSGGQGISLQSGGNNFTFNNLVTGFIDLYDTPSSYSGNNNLFAKVTGETGLYFASITESDISDLGSYATSGDLQTHIDASSIHFTQAEILITESQVTDLQDYALNSKVDTLSGYAENHITATNNPHSVTAAQVGSPTLSVFNSHTGNNNIHFTQGEISITESQISDFGDYALDSKVNTLSGNLSTHINDSSIHFTEASIVLSANQITGGQFDNSRISESSVTQHQSALSITESQVTDLGNYLTNVNGLSGDFTGHSGNSSIHFTQAEILLSESQISDLQDYALDSKVDTLSGHVQSHINQTNNPHSVTASQVGAPSLAVFTGHTGNSDLHYLQSEISITESQISDLGDYALQSYASGLSGEIESHVDDSTIHFTEASIDHGSIAGLGGDDHIQYVPTSASRGFTAEVSGKDPTQPYHLSTKNYVDNQIVSASSGVSEGLFSSHTGDSTIHFTQASISITESQISDLGDYALDSKVDTLSGHTQAHINNTSNPHGVTAAQISAAGLTEFNSHTGNGAIHFTQGSIQLSASQITGGTFDNARIAQSNVTQHQAALSITESQISDLDNYLTNVDGLSGDFTGHSGDSNIHFLMNEISITESQISNLGDYALDSKVDTLSGYTQSHISNTSNPHSVTASQVGSPTLAIFNSHTGTTGVHFTQDQIVITESQISDLGDYATNTKVDTLSGYAADHINSTSNPHNVTATQVGAPTIALFQGHTGQSNIHYLQSEINLTASQITGGTLNDARVAQSNVTQHQSALTVTESQVSDLGDYALNSKVNTLSGYTETHISDTSNPHSVNAAQVGAPSIEIFTGHSGDSSVHFTESSINHSNIQNVGSNTHAQIDTHIADSSIHFTEASIDHGSIAGLSDDDHTQYVPTNASRGFTAEISGLDPTLDYHLATKGYVDAQVVSSSSGVSEALFSSHTGNSDIHFTQAQISITESQVSDLGNYALDSKVDSLSGYTQNHIDNTSNPHGVTAAQISAAGSSEFNSHTGNGSIHYTQDNINLNASQITGGTFSNSRIAESNVTQHQASLSITESQISDLGNYLTNVNGLSGDFTGHSGDSSIHFTQGEISITESQISDLGSYATVSSLNTVSGELTSHTSDDTIHFTEASIDHTNISNIGTNTHAQIDSHIASTANPHNVTLAQLSGANLSDFNSHTGNAAIHYLQSDISIGTQQITSGFVSDERISESSVVQHEGAITVKEDQISDFGNYTLVDGSKGFTNPVSGKNPVQSYDLSTKAYIDSELTGHTGAVDPHIVYIKADGTRPMAGQLNLNSNRIINVADPVNLQDVATGGWALGNFPLLVQNGLDYNAATFRTNIGLGNSATLNVGTTAGTVAAGDHGLADHDDVTIGTLSDGSLLAWNSLISLWSITNPGPALTAAFGDGSGEITEGNDERLLAARLHAYVASVPNVWHLTGLTYWSQAASGTGTSFLQSGQFWSICQEVGTGSVLHTQVGAGISGTNAVARFMQKNNGLFLPAGRLISFRATCFNLSEIQFMRVGYASGGSNPTASGRPSSGMWLEFDRSVSATNWYLVVGASSSYTAIDTGRAVTNMTWDWFVLEWLSSSDVRAYAVTPGGTATQLAQATTNCPSTHAERAGTLFTQIEKITTGVSSANGVLFVDRLEAIIENSVMPRLP